MKDVFIIDADEEQEVLQQLKDANNTVDAAMKEFERGNSSVVSEGEHRESLIRVVTSAMC